MYRRFSEAERAEIWDSFERGESERAIARKLQQQGLGQTVPDRQRGPTSTPTREL